MSSDIEVGSLEYFSRKIAYLFGFYIFYTFAYRQPHFPEGPEEIGTFVFLTFFNFGVQWACYRLTYMCTRDWLDKAIFAIQLLMFGWTVYAYRFAYMTGMAYNREAYFYVPLQQYGIIFILFIFLLILSTKDTRG